MDMSFKVETHNMRFPLVSQARDTSTNLSDPFPRLCYAIDQQSVRLGSLQLTYPSDTLFNS